MQLRRVCVGEADQVGNDSSRERVHQARGRVGATRRQQLIEQLIDEPGDIRLEIVDALRAEPGREELAMECVLGRVGTGEDVELLGGDLVENTERPVISRVQQVTEVVRELIGSARRLGDLLPRGDEIGVRGRDLPDGRLAAQLGVERMRVVDQLGARESALGQ